MEYFTHKGYNLFKIIKIQSWEIDTRKPGGMKLLEVMAETNCPNKTHSGYYRS